MKKKISLLLIIAIMTALFVVPDTSLQVYAATNTIKLTTISRPDDIESLKNQDEGIIYQTIYGDDKSSTIYKFTIKERGWVIFETNHDSSFDWYIGMCNNVFKNLSLTSKVDSLRCIMLGNDVYRHCYYLDKGTYYIDSRNSLGEYVFGYFLPNSKILKHTLKQSKDGAYYTDKIKLSAHFGTTRMFESIVDVKDILKSGDWDSYETNAEDRYKISANGEYTIRASFTDKEWKDFPAMYSFTIYNIVKPPKAPTPKVSSKTKKTIQVSWNKVTGIKKYELQYSTSSSFKKSATKTKAYNSSQKSAKLTGLKSKRKYYVRIRAYKLFKGNKVYSNWSKTKTVVTK